MAHGWKAINHTIFLRPKRGGVICCHTAKNNFIITVHWNVGKISDLILGRIYCVHYLGTLGTCDLSGLSEGPE